jgi:hypothetical protein
MASYLFPKIIPIKKFAILIVLITCQFSSKAQKDLPTIQSNSKDIIIKDILDGRNTTVNWLLNPTIKPDAYFVGNSLKKRRVTFITDVDSISFDVLPGRHYDFIILLNGKEECFTQVAAMSNPLFFRPDVLAISIALLLLTILIVYKKRNSIQLNVLLKLGAITAVLFWNIAHQLQPCANGGQ